MHPVPFLPVYHIQGRALRAAGPGAVKLPHSVASYGHTVNPIRIWQEGPQPFTVPGFTQFPQGLGLYMAYSLP